MDKEKHIFHFSLILLTFLFNKKTEDQQKYQSMLERLGPVVPKDTLGWERSKLICNITIFTIDQCLNALYYRNQTKIL